MDIFWLAWIFLDFLTHTSHMNVHGSDIPGIIHAPHKIQQLFPAVYFVGIAHQKLQQLELFAGEVDFPVLNKQPAAFAIQP